MKQKKIGSDLYVFDTSAYQLTKDLDAENIYIQQELIPGYKAVNSSTGVQAKIKPINYKLNIIQKPVWGDYIYADEEVEVTAIAHFALPGGWYEYPNDYEDKITTPRDYAFTFKLKLNDEFVNFTEHPCVLYSDNELSLDPADRVDSGTQSTLYSKDPGTLTLRVEYPLIGDIPEGYIEIPITVEDSVS